MDDSSAPEPGTLPSPVPTRRRHDGWTPRRQHDFIAALAESGCVTEACAAVGLSPKSAYRLRTRPDATIFRQAWDIALDQAIRRLTDAAYSRAIHGVVTPVFYQGEQIGERRRYDERLTMFLLRYRDPTRYGAWLDQYEARRHPDGPGITLAHALNRLSDAAHDYADPDEGDSARPLADGPVDQIAAHAEREQLAEREAALVGASEETREAARSIFAYLDANRDQPPDDPIAADMRDPLTTLRPLAPRSGSSRDVA